MNYAQKLQDPRWQRVRLEVLDREDFTCEWCQATNKTLHVHHGYYQKGLEPWEYNTNTLHCLCEDCHPEVQALTTEAHHLFASLSHASFDTVLGFLRYRAAECREDEAARIVVENAEVLDGLSRACGLPEREIENLVKPGDSVSLGELYRRWVELWRQARARRSA